MSRICIISTLLIVLGLNVRAYSVTVDSISPPITAKISYLGIKGKATICYYYQEANVLRKPIVIVKGFDPQNKQNFDSLYHKLDYNDGANNLAAELLTLGYDIVFVDFRWYHADNGQHINGGSDYIQRNAFTLIEVINTLNQQLKNTDSEHQIVIIGQSMGGLVTRYALKYMEQNSTVPETKREIFNPRTKVTQ